MRLGAAAMLILLVAGAGAGAVPGSQGPPNIVIALVDDLGWNGPGFNGHNTEVRTPFIDSLASQGVIFDSHYGANALLFFELVPFSLFAFPSFLFILSAFKQVNVSVHSR